MGTFRRLAIIFLLVVPGAAFCQTEGIIASSVGSGLLQDQYWVLKSATFNFTPVTQNIADTITDVVGDPSKAIVTATNEATGWSISTIGTDTTLWNPDPDLSDKSSAAVGMLWPTPSDPYNYQRFDSAIITTGFINYRSQHVPGTYNMKLSGLDPNDLYQIHLIGSITFTDSTSQGVFATRTKFSFADGRSNSLNTQFRTSKAIVEDTMRSNASGEISFDVTGQDSTYDKGSMGIISGVTIYEISKDSSAGAKKTQLYRNYYDTTLLINDGTKDRLCIVYKPYNYDPAKSYPVFLYMDGQEDAVNDDQWDAQVLIGDGMGLVGEGEKGKIYGLDANGDTASFVTLIPQTSNTEFGLTAGQMHTLLANFKAKDLYNTNSTLDLAGFSSGGASVVDFLYTYPSEVHAAFIQSPAAAPPAGNILADTSAKFQQYGTHVWLVKRGDAFANYVDSLSKYISLYAPNNLYERYQLAKDHSGFAYEYMPSTIDEVYPQNLFSFFANPTENRRKVSFFSIWTPSESNIQFWTPTYNGSSVNAASTVLYGSDTKTGWHLNTVSTAKWDGLAAAVDAPNSIRNYNFYTTSAVQNGRAIYSNGSYASDGNNLHVNGLDAGKSYTVYMAGFAGAGANPPVITQYGINGTSFTTFCSSCDINTTLPAKLVGTASDSGTIDLSVYPDPNSTNAGYGAFAYMIIRETNNDTSHRAPIVSAGEDKSIRLPVDNMTLTGTVRNDNTVGGAIVSTTWSIISQPSGADASIANPSTMTPTVTDMTLEGDYGIALSATDDSGYTAKDTMFITVLPEIASLPVGSRILVDLGGAGAGATSTTSPQTDGRYWNTLDGSPSGSTFPKVYSTFVDTADNAVDMTVTQSAAWWSGQSSVNTGGGWNDQVEDYPASACKDSWIINSVSSPQNLTITLPAGTYTIKFWGCRSTSGTLTTSIKLSTDASYTTYNASNNSDYDNAAVFTEIVSDGSTPIVFNVSGSSSSNNFGYIGVIDIHKTDE